MSPVVLELPMPPSVNSIWRARRNSNGKPGFYLDPKYKAWKLACDAVFWTLHPRPVSIVSPVKVEITLSPSHARVTSDTDNRVKACLDFLQRAGIIANDNQVKDVRAHWGEAPRGCRVTVEAIL